MMNNNEPIIATTTKKVWTKPEVWVLEKGYVNSGGNGGHFEFRFTQPHHSHLTTGSTIPPAAFFNYSS